jgi:predicted regulator of Ras-like GTPase activity (Roadblock/LC7/MglB family)
VDQPIQALTNVTGIDGALLISKDGLVVAQSGRLDNLEVDMVAAATSELFISALSLSHEQMGRGLLETLTFEGPQGRFVVQFVTDDVFLLVLGSKKVQLGMLRFEAREAAARLKSVL